MSIAIFWDSSFGEVTDLIESYNRRKSYKQKEQLMINEILAIQIGDVVSALFSKDAKVRSVKELVPDLFGGQETEEEKQEREWREHMYKMREYTARQNKKRKES